MSENEHLLVLQNRNRKVFNAWFSIGCVAFVCSMFFKSMHNEKIAALPLAISTFILMLGVWKLSGTGKIYFDKSVGKIYCFYKHLGYVQKLYTHSILSIENVELHNHSLAIRMDNSELISISTEKISSDELKELAERVAGFLGVKLLVS